MKFITSLCIIVSFIVVINATPQEFEKPDEPIKKLEKYPYECTPDKTLDDCYSEAVAQNSCQIVTRMDDHLEINKCGTESCDEGYRIIEGKPGSEYPDCCASCEKQDEKKYYYQTGEDQ